MDHTHGGDEPYFYPRSPCGERPLSCRVWQITLTFLSTLSLRRATVMDALYAVWKVFLSTLSLRRATRGAWCRAGLLDISIHALLAESDVLRGDKIRRDVRFLSTLSLRRATSRYHCPSRQQKYFYPRSPCGERPGRNPPIRKQPKFLSTLSLRRATLNGLVYNISSLISIHALLAESDRLAFRHPG